LKPTDLQQTSQQRPDKGCTSIFYLFIYLFIYTVEGEGGGGMEFYFSAQKEGHMKTKNKSEKIKQYQKHTNQILGRILGEKNNPRDIRKERNTSLLWEFL